MHLLLVGGSRAERGRAALAREAASDLHPSSIISLDAATLPFVRPERARLPAVRPRIIRLDHLEHAFRGTQQGGTRLVLTQSTYTLQKWIDVLEADDRIVATADREALARVAPEAFQARGPWRHFTIVDVTAPRSAEARARNREAAGRNVAVTLRPSPLERLLARAFRSASPSGRARLCGHAVAAAPASAVAYLALASVCRERQRLPAARAALDAAIRLAPQWEAVHYEDGKFWLACDDLVQSAEAFKRAAALMPAFSAAFSNLGATLGELDQPQAALDAFTHALTSDPESFTILNNLAVVNRELGRLVESEAAARKVVAIAPEFVFGHYNLGHTLFLAGRFGEAVSAYEEGQRRDPEKNRRQGCRLAVVRFANGDVAGAERDLARFTREAPPDEREDLLLEAYEIAEAVVRAQPAPGGDRRFLEHIASRIKLD